jgi:hypothetical protein
MLSQVKMWASLSWKNRSSSNVNFGRKQRAKIRADFETTFCGTPGGFADQQTKVDLSVRSKGNRGSMNP